jgi:predicted kinase
MVGIPASGKSTYARSLDCRVVCPDEILSQFPGWNGDQVFELARQLVVETLKGGEDVVLDATATIRRWRTRDIAAGKSHADRVVCVWMDASLEVCLRWNAERIQRDGYIKVPPQEIERMHRNLAMNTPELTEGFDEIRRITVVA